MKRVVYYLLISTCYGTTPGTIEELRAPHVETFLELKRPYNLDSDEALIQYLPQRLASLASYCKQQGIQKTCSWIEHDPDLDSYLFIIKVQEPYELMAYSRTPSFFHTTPQELQRLLFPHCHIDMCSIERTFKQIVSTAQKGTTYIRYVWQAYLEPYPQYQIAYVQMATENDQKYVLGAAIYRKWLGDHVILPHRVNTIIKQIQAQGLDHVLPLINNEIDPEFFFFIVDLQYPFRYIAHGKNTWLVNKTPEEEQRLYPPCYDPLCDISAIVQSLVKVAQQGQGFHAYLFRTKPTEKPTLKIVYVKKFVYKKHAYLIGTGYTPLIAAKKIEALNSAVKSNLKLITQIGLENAISSFKKNPIPDTFLFVNEAEPPYRYAYHPDQDFSGLTATEVSQFFHKKFKRFPVNIVELVQRINKFAQSGGGLHAIEYLVDPENPHEGNSLEIAYTSPFEHKHKKYFMSLGISAEPTPQQLKQAVSA